MSECARYEPTIDEIMADPTVHALMRADRVNVERLRLKLLQHASASGPVEHLALRQPRNAGLATPMAMKPWQGRAWG